MVFESAVLICAGQACWYLLAVQTVQTVQTVQKVQKVQTVQEVQGVRTAVCLLVRQGSHPPRSRDGVFSGCRYPCGPWFPGGPAAGPPSLRVEGPCSSADRRSVRGEAGFRRRDTSVSGSPPCSANDSESPGSAPWSPLSGIPMSTHDEAPLDTDRSEQGRYTQVPSESSLLASSPFLREDPSRECRFAGSAGRGEGVEIVAPRRPRHFGIQRRKCGGKRLDLALPGQARSEVTWRRILKRPPVARANQVRARFLLGLQHRH